MKGQGYTIYSEHTLKCFQEWVGKTWQENKYMHFEAPSFDKTRSRQQNSALHVYFGLLATALNDAGYPLVIIINQKETEIDWSGDLVKEFMWRPIQEALKKERSTAKVSTKDYPEIYENLNRHTASRLGISIDWPTQEGRK